MRFQASSQKGSPHHGDGRLTRATAKDKTFGASFAERERRAKRSHDRTIKIAISIAIVAFLVLSAALSSPQARDSTARAMFVTTVVVDSVGDVGQYSSIDIDLHDSIHISYRDTTNSNLKYATNESGAWLTYTIDHVGNLGGYTSIAVGNDTTSYYDAGNSTWYNATWPRAPVFISYYDISNSNLKVADNGTTMRWINDTKDAVGMVGLYTSMAADSLNKMHVSYCDQTHQSLKYATNASGSWQNRTVDNAGSVGLWTSIAVDSNGKAHISYYDNSNSHLKYATNAGGSWQNYTVDASGTTGTYTSIAIDQNNRAHISYYDIANGNLKYANNTAGTWANTTLDSTGDVGQYSSIAVDSNGRSHISYFDDTNGNLKYATDANGTWQTFTLDSTGVVGEYTSIAIDSGNNRYISYYDSTNGNLKCMGISDPASVPIPEFSAVLVPVVGVMAIALVIRTGRRKVAGSESVKKEGDAE